MEDVEFKNKFIISKIHQNKAYDKFKEWYIKKAENNIIPRVKFYADSLGVKYNSIKIIELRYRWGSCTPKNNIHINWKILKAPNPVINYIIVHELAHLLEANHTPKFWNIVKAQLPTYKKAKEWLKENGNILEVDF